MRQWIYIIKYHAYSENKNSLNKKNSPILLLEWLVFLTPVDVLVAGLVLDLSLGGW